MIVLDTNVLSALMLERPDRAVVVWLDGQPRTSIWTTSITLFEMRCDLLALAAGRRQAALEVSLARLINERLEQRVLPFDRVAADAAANLHDKRNRAGLPRELRDTMIAGITLANNASLATRNVRHFDDLRISVIDPWAAR